MNNWYSTIAFGVVGSLIAACLVACIQKRQELRNRLREAQAGRKRRRYVNRFVRAVRHGNSVFIARSLCYLLMVIPVAITFWLFVFSLSVETTISRNKSIVENTQLLYNETTQPGEIERERAKNMALLKKNTLFLSSGNYLVRGLALLTWLTFMWMLIFWEPFVVYHACFVHELDRFRSRIQILASKSELADLVDLEAKVEDEDTAREFVNKMTDIAKRHQVERLVDTFRLWDTQRKEDT